MSFRSVSYALFVVVTGVLFVRPTELISSLNDAPVYEVTILCCLAVSAPLLAGQLTWRSLRRNPVTACVLGLLPAVALSHLSHAEVAGAVAGTVTFLKVVLSYLLLVGVLNTTARLRGYLGWLFAFILGLTTLALLQHYEVIDNPALAAHQERVFDKDTGDVVGVNVRLCGAGIFANPNDLSRILVVGIALSLYFMDGGAPALLRPVWLAAIGLFGHALLLTQSRGGFLDLVATLLVLFHARVGARRTFLLAAAVLPVLALVFGGGRQTDLSTSEGTGQQRIQLWSDGLEALRSSPLFGLGMDQYAGITGGLGAHNSFVHAYVELGFFGGTLFVAAGFCALRVCGRSGGPGWPVTTAELGRIRPYLFAIVAGYVVGMFSSSRCYAFPTYFLLGLVVAYARLARADLLLPSLRVTPRWALATVLLSALVLAAIQAYVLTFAQFGGG